MSKYKKKHESAIYYIANIAPRRLFKDATIMWGVVPSFTLEQVAVRFFEDAKSMEVTVFDLDGKMRTSNYLIPESENGLIKKLRAHCGEELINKQMRNNITIL